MLSLTLTDFVAALPFSNKIEDRQIQPFVAESYTLDLVPLLGHEVLEKVGLLAIPTTIQEYSPAVAVVQNQYCRRHERVYLASGTTPIVTVPGGAGWTYEPLLTLWTEYLKPYWIRASFARFLPQHGRDFTKAGITTPTDREGTFQPTSASDRANLQAAHDTATEALRSRLLAFRRSETAAYVHDNATGYDYGQDHACRPASSLRAPLRGINARRR